MEELEKEDKKDSECDVEMEEGSQAADWDSDETVVEGSVTESDPEEEALPWRRSNTGHTQPLPNCNLRMKWNKMELCYKRVLTSPEISQEERLFRKMNDFEPRELANPLSNSSSSISIPLTCHRDFLEDPKDDALPVEVSTALNTLSDAKVEPICHRKEGGISLGAGNECSGVEPGMSQTDEDCTQIAEVDFETLCSTPPFEQDSKLAELQDKHLPVQQLDINTVALPGEGNIVGLPGFSTALLFVAEDTVR
ncbi:hypothetical protein E5288_WYG001992 [Bos mutus]|uniref:Uncharacterized protein n=1 Tax=Bos mutus TaxID=72004 RepID=A0A6B0RSB4_9CETA|nr:hypothetical protein [Bos mutus]